MGAVSLRKAAYHYREMCKMIGIDITSADTQATPERVVRLLHDFQEGGRAMPFEFTTFPATDFNRNQLVNVCGVRLVSLCSHHHFPFMGLAHVCYLPNDKLVGLSKIPRLVRWLGKLPTMQETLTSKIVEKLREELKPRFIGVRLIAEHTCMSCRGVGEPESMTCTDAFWCDEAEQGKQGRKLDVGDYETTKQEFFRAIDEWYRAKSLR